MKAPSPSNQSQTMPAKASSRSYQCLFGVRGRHYGGSVGGDGAQTTSPRNHAGTLAFQEAAFGQRAGIDVPSTGLLLTKINLAVF